jgi:hypothetical protein
MNTIGRCAAGFILTVGLGGTAMAADPPDPALKGLADCAGVADLTAKAACYDAASAALSSAVKSGEIIIVRKKEAQAAQRNAFGFNLPSLNIFDRVGGGGDKKEAKKDEKTGEVVATGGLDALSTEIKSASQDGNGHWVITTVEGAVWRQTDNEVLAPRPRAGQKIEIKRAALGSYLLKIDRLPAIRVKRSE